MVSIATPLKTPKMAGKFRFVLPLDLPLIASVGFHALLFTMILPKWNWSDSSKQQEKIIENTPVIELSPIEQSRLPDFTPTVSPGWDLLSQIPNTSVQIPPLPTSNAESFQFPLMESVNTPNLPPLPSYPINYPTNYPTNYSYNIPNSSTLPPPPPSFTGDFPAPPSEGQFTDITNAEQERLNRRDSLFPLEGENQQMPSPREIINARNNQAVQQNEDSQFNQQLAVNSNIAKPSNYGELTAALQKDFSNTTGEQATKNDIAWRSQANVVTPKTINILGYYPKDACIRRLQGTAAYGVTVNSQGNVINVQLLQGAGYAIFNQQGFRQVQTANYGNTGGNQAYHVYVNFKPTDCPSLSLANLGQIPAQNTPNITKPVSVPNINTQQQSIQEQPPITNKTTEPTPINQINQSRKPTVVNSVTPKTNPNPNNVNNSPAPSQPSQVNTPKPEENVSPPQTVTTTTTEPPIPKVETSSQSQPSKVETQAPSSPTRVKPLFTRQYNHLRRNNPNKGQRNLSLQNNNSNNSSVSPKADNSTPAVENTPKLESNNTPSPAVPNE